MKSKKGFQSDIQSLANLKAASDAAKAAGEPLMSTAHLKPNAYTKAKAQVKSSFYYYFWGTATLAVVVGQFIVGTGFRRMAQAVDDLGATATILIEMEDLKRRGDFNYIDFDIPEDYEPSLADPAILNNPLINAYTK
tara:strand:- start:2114 stop:2524 length:411 start_codon:yes stop_codon:yes gene_type:complete